MIVTVNGLLGVGKSTLTTNLCTLCDYTLMPEPVESNPFLNKYYEDPNRYAFDMQIFLLFERVKQSKEAYFRSLRGETIVIDSNIYSDMAFALVQRDDNYFIPEEFDLYKNLYDYMTVNIKYPDILFWLELKPEDAMERIKKRSRECESNIPIEYLNSLYNAHKKVLDELKGKCNVVELDARKSKAEIICDAMNVIVDYKK